MTAFARLHLGFLDLDGGLGRRFGGLGIGLAGPATRLTLGRSPQTRAAGPDAERALRHLRDLTARLGIALGHRLVVHEAIPAHAGLGSGTQLALAVATAACRLHGRREGPAELARMLGRGRRSGLGVATFAGGGVVMDGGRAGDGRTPPTIARLSFPDDWRVLLILDRSRQGAHGGSEAAALARLAPFPAERAGHLCRLAVMAALPALAERDLAGFGSAIAEIQRVVGDHFAPAQGGRFMSADVSAALAWLVAEGVRGVGQSSWGPTGFGIVGEDEADRLAARLRARFADRPNLRVAVSAGRNAGSAMEIG